MTENCTITVLDHHKACQLDIKRMAVYHMFKLIEASDSKKQTFFLIYFKNRFLAAIKPLHFNKRSQLYRAFQNGIVFHAPHPFMNTLIEQNRTSTIQSFQHLLKQWQHQYSSMEIAHFLPLFDSILEKEDIIKLIRDIFYEYRRNGNYFLAYRVIRLLKQYAPENPWIEQMSNDLSFRQYDNIYQNDDALWEKDKLMAEQLFFERSTNDEEAFTKLQSELLEQNRWIDRAALSIRHMLHSRTPEKDYDSLRMTLSSFLSDQDIALVLLQLHQQGAAFPALEYDLFDLLLKLHWYERAINLLFDQHSPMTEFQFQQFSSIMADPAIRMDQIQLEKINTLPVNKQNAGTIEKTIRLIIPLLLKNHDLNYVKEWLQPFEEQHISLPSAAKINRMLAIQDDPDQQFLLGELYFEFQQPKKAIDCFSWEMELHPNDPKPVQWLAKIYSQLGMTDEAKAYQYMYSSMRK
jgi:tetratricopeptide (TPR) repeat protein